jgi:hypothetical protein
MVQPESVRAVTEARLEALTGANVMLHGATGGGVTSDTTAIHAARDAAGVGGVLYFPPGTYLTGGLTANAAGQRWLLADGATLKLSSATNAPVVTVTAANVTIEGGTVDGNRAGQSSGAACFGVTAVAQSGLSVRDVTIQNTFQEGIYLDSCSDFRIERNTLTNCAQSGNHKAVFVNDTTGSLARGRVRDNTIDGSTSLNGGMQFACVVSGHTMTDLVVSDNIILVGDGPSSANTLGIELYTNTGGIIDGATVVGNDIQCVGVGTAAFGISLGGVATTSTTGNWNMTVAGNAVRNCHSAGVELIGRNLVCSGNSFDVCGRISAPSVDVAGDMTGIVISGNTIRNAQDANYAIQLTGNATNAHRGTVVVGNIIDSPTGVGMQVQSRFYDGIIANNVIRKPGGVCGILVPASADVAGTRISGNRIDMTGAPANADGILIASTSVVDLAIEGNVITAHTRHGIYLNVAVSRVTIKDNHIYGGTTAATSNGITTNGGDRYTIVGNHVHDNPNRGISLSGSPTNTFLGTNSCYSNTNGDIVTGGTFVPLDVSGTTGTTAPSAGGAGALPATPAGYLTIRVNGTSRQVPYY